MVQLLQLIPVITYSINPFLKPRLELYPGHLETCLAAQAAAEQVVTRTKYVKAAICFLFILAWNEYLILMHIIRGILQQYARILAEVPAVRDGLVRYRLVRLSYCEC